MEWLEFGDADATALADLNGLARECADDVMGLLEERFLALPESARFVGDPELLEYVKGLQSAYFLRLTEGRYDECYVRERLTIGALHEAVGLDLKWYLGVYNLYLRAFLARIHAAYPDDLDLAADAYAALTKLVFFDLGLAIDTYVKQREATIDDLSTRRRVVADIVGAQEEERKRIAADIHDDTVQAMTAVLIRLGTLAARLDDPDAARVVRQLESSVSDCIARLRRLIVDLRPPELDRDGLAAALRSSLVQLEQEYPISCTLQNELISEPGSDARAIAYRVAQEAIANVRKHAGATHLRLRLAARGGGLLATVTDDGCGFDVARALRSARPGHLGLAAMRERIELAGGRLELTSDDGGTTVEFWVPDLAVAKEVA